MFILTRLVVTPDGEYSHHNMSVYNDMKEAVVNAINWQQAANYKVWRIEEACEFDIKPPSSYTIEVAQQVEELYERLTINPPG